MYMYRYADNSNLMEKQIVRLCSDQGSQTIKSTKEAFNDVFSLLSKSEGTEGSCFHRVPCLFEGICGNLLEKICS